VIYSVVQSDLLKRNIQFVRLMCYNAQLGLAAKGWIDEMYIEDSTLKDIAGYHAMRERLSRNLICVSVVIDTHKNSVAVVYGHGKPNKKRAT
jgi:hypothetical protein